MNAGDFFVSAPTLLMAVVAGYVLGALPLAEQISRRNGVDIFSAGTGLAGASNVLKSVGKLPALIVLIGDLGKGGLAVIIGDLLGLEGPWLVIPVFAAVVGHWKSVFLGFRGGDGLATLGGATVALFPITGVISVAVAGLVAFGGQRMPYSSLLSVVFGYATLVALSLTNDGDTVLALGVGGIAGLVLAYALLGHRRRRSAAASEWDDDDEPEGFTERSGYRS